MSSVPSYDESYGSTASRASIPKPREVFSFASNVLGDYRLKKSRMCLLFDRESGFGWEGKSAVSIDVRVVEFDSNRQFALLVGERRDLRATQNLLARRFTRIRDRILDARQEQTARIGRNRSLEVQRARETWNHLQRTQGI
jgi:hypothetical protein